MEAIERALADPAPRKVHGTKARPGIFLSSAAAAQTAAQRCIELALIEQRGQQQARGKVESLYGVTPAGIAYLLDHNPAERSLKAACDAMERLAHSTAECQKSLDQVQEQASRLREVVQAAASRVQPPDVKAMLAAVQPTRAADPDVPPAAAAQPSPAGPSPALCDELLAHLGQQKSQAPLRPVDLPQLFRFVRSKQPALSVGQFHDLGRRMATAGQIRLSPFTQAMYQLPEPEYAMILGREIMYYVERV